MYESPLEKIYGNIQSQIIKQDEENIMFSVNQAVGYSVDKQELIKALNYDRDQYKKGYADAMADIKTEIADIDGDINGYYVHKDDVLAIIDKHMRGTTDE